MKLMMHKLFKVYISIELPRKLSELLTLPVDVGLTEKQQKSTIISTNWGFLLVKDASHKFISNTL